MYKINMQEIHDCGVKKTTKQQRNKKKKAGISELVVNFPIDNN